MPNHPHFLNPAGPLEITENRLPHWSQIGACYFLTFRLTDSVPRELWEPYEAERRAWIQSHPDPWDETTTTEFHERFSGELEKWLDRGLGSCVLKASPCAAAVAGALQHFEGTRSRMEAFVIMPNHVHALVQPLHDHSIADLINSWKSFSAKQINRLMDTSGPVWQKSYFDRILRDWTHFARVVRYIRRNPEKARLKVGEYLLWESDWIRKQWA